MQLAKLLLLRSVVALSPVQAHEERLPSVAVQGVSAAALIDAFVLAHVRIAINAGHFVEQGSFTTVVGLIVVVADVVAFEAVSIGAGSVVVATVITACVVKVDATSVFVPVFPHKDTSTWSKMVFRLCAHDTVSPAALDAVLSIACQDARSTNEQQRVLVTSH
jgi:hypothetical protein